MTLSENAFNRQCFQFIRKCKQYADEGWSLSLRLANGQIQALRSDQLDLCQVDGDKLMLVKDEKKKCAAGNDMIYTYEYNVIYSESYEVPVMYFCVSDQNGSHVAPGEILKTSARDLSSVVNQIEHPFLFRPFYMIHPCRTRDFMEAHLAANEDCYLISWLSIVGTLMDLRLSDQFGRLDMS